MWMTIANIFLIPLYLIIFAVLLSVLLNGVIQMLSAGIWGVTKRVF